MNAPNSKHLKELKGFFADPAICRDSHSLLIHLATRLAAVGHAAKVLAIVERSPEAALFRPLADGLRLHLGKEIEAEGPSYERAVEIAEQIVDEVAA